MNTQAIIIAAIVAALAIVAAVALKKKKARTGYDIDLPPVANPRKIPAGNYLMLDDQAEETKGLVGIAWMAEHGGAAKVAQNMLTLNCPTVLELTGLLFERLKGNQTLRVLPDDERWANLTAFFDMLRAEGVMHLVHAIAPFDEPNLYYKNSDAETVRALAMTRKLIAHYPELSGVKLACIYMTDGRPYHCLHEFDFVGFDNYKLQSSIFKPGGLYDQFRAQLRPGQQTILVPGGGWEGKPQDPVPFVRFAQSNAEVGMVIAFMWGDRPGEHGTIHGIRSNGMAPQYETAFRALAQGQTL